MNAHSAAAPGGWDQGRAAIAIVLGLTLLRFALAPFVPLAYDEAYYWRWSLYPDIGYFDHPPLVAWLIRLGTGIAGDSEFGIRLVPLLLSIPASWAVWRSAVILFGDRRLAMTALVFFNVMLIVAVGTILATPDASLLVASAFLLFALAKIAQTGRPAWWIVAGIITGIGCLAKFTALFWLPSILLWLMLSPRMRPWLRTPWPWMGAITAVLLFFPNLVWNAENDWLTFGKQFGRVAADGFTPQYVIEHIGTEIGMATPVIFALGWLALIAFVIGRGGTSTVRFLLLALILPMTIYFVFHSFHARVEGNWTGPIFPAFALSAAAAVHGIEWKERALRWVRILRAWAAPVGIAVVLAIYGQTILGWLPLGTWDPTASRLGAGMEAVAEEVDAIRQSENASLIVTDSYPMTGWLSFYGPAGPTLVYQHNERERWLQEPSVPPEALRGPIIAVLPAGEPVDEIASTFGEAEYLTIIQRRRGSLIIAEYAVYRLPGMATQN